MRDLHRRIDKVEGEFSADTDYLHVVHVTCKCGHKGEVDAF